MQRYVLTLEAIGDNHRAWLRHCDQVLDATGHLPPCASWHLKTIQRQSPRGFSWVARLVGLDARYDFVRVFVRAQKDYRSANSTGSRGVQLYYFLEPGLYEIQQRLTWKRSRRYFLRVSSQSVAHEVTKEEALACLQPPKSAS